MADRSVVVVGGGVTGVLTARELCLAGWDVTLLEGEHIGSGSSSRTAAGIRQQFSTEGTVRGMRYAVDFYRRFQEETEGNAPCIVQNGYLFLHDDEARWERAREVVALQQRAGLAEVEALSAAELTARFGWVDGDAIVGGTWCPTDGFLLPHVVYNDGARRVRELGGTIRQRAPVTGAQVEGDRIVAVETPKGPVSADLFVDCTNAWTARTGRILGAEPLPVAPLKRYLWFLGRDGAMTAETLAGLPLTICPDGTYVKPESGELLQMGRKHDTPPEPDFTYDDQDTIEPAYAHTGDLEALPFELWARVAEVLPAVGEFAGIQYTTAGFYGTTPDHNPFLGFDPRRRNLIRLVGFSGHGAMMAPFTARIGAALAEAGRDVETLDLEGASIELGGFRIGRAFEEAEEMVI